MGQRAASQPPACISTTAIARQELPTKPGGLLGPAETALVFGGGDSPPPRPCGSTVPKVPAVGLVKSVLGLLAWQQQLQEGHVQDSGE